MLFLFTIAWAKRISNEQKPDSKYDDQRSQLDKSTDSIQKEKASKDEKDIIDEKIDSETHIEIKPNGAIVLNIKEESYDVNPFRMYMISTIGTVSVGLYSLIVQNDYFENMTKMVTSIICVFFLIAYEYEMSSKHFKVVTEAENLMEKYQQDIVVKKKKIMLISALEIDKIIRRKSKQQKELILKHGLDSNGNSSKK